MTEEKTPSTIAKIAGYHYRFPYSTKQSIRYVSEDVLYRSATEGPQTLAAWRENHERLLSAFELLTSEIEHQAVNDDLVITHWSGTARQIAPFQGAAPTGAVIRMRGFGIDRVRDGLVVEHWGLQDALGMFRQLGFTLQPPK